MPLFDPQAKPEVTPAAAAHAAHAFLSRCRDWARDREIPDRLERVEVSKDPLEAAKLHEWIAYLRFIEHTLAELEAGALDHWFLGASSAAGGESGKES